MPTLTGVFLGGASGEPSAFLSSLSAPSQNLQVTARLPSDPLIRVSTAQSAEGVKSFDEALSRFREYVASAGMSVALSNDERSDRLVIRVFSHEGSLVRQIPSDEMLALFSKMRSEQFVRLLSLRA